MLFPDFAKTAKRAMTFSGNACMNVWMGDGTRGGASDKKAISDKYPATLKQWQNRGEHEGEECVEQVG